MLQGEAAIRLRRSQNGDVEVIEMDIKPIRTEADDDAALDEIATLMTDDSLPGTRHGDRLDVLVMLTQAYQAKHHQVLPPAPIDAKLSQVP